MGATMNYKKILVDSYKMERKAIDNYRRVFEDWCTKDKQNVNKTLVRILFEGDNDRYRALDTAYRTNKEGMEFKDLEEIRCFNKAAMSISRIKAGSNLLDNLVFVKEVSGEIVAKKPEEVLADAEVIDPKEVSPTIKNEAVKKAAGKKTGTRTREVKKDSLPDILHKALDLAKVQGNDLLTASIIKCIEMAKLSIPSSTHAKQVARAEEDVFDLWEEELEEETVVVPMTDDEDIFANFG